MRRWFKKMPITQMKRQWLRQKRFATRTSQADEEEAPDEEFEEKEQAVSGAVEVEAETDAREGRPTLAARRGSEEVG